MLERHPAVAGDVAQGPRSRILHAITRVVAERGYAAATVADVVSAAGVSRSTFYEHFAGKDDCFLQAYRHGVDVMVDDVREAVRGADGWRAQLRAGIGAYLAALAAEPAFARAYLLEIHAAGPRALDARTENMRRFADRYRATFEAARAEDRSLREPHPDALMVLCAGTEQLCAERIRAGEDLLELEDVFCDCAEAVLHRPA